MKWIKWLIARWRAETPKVWRWVRNVSATLSAMAVASYTAITAVGIVVSPTWASVFAYVIGVTAAIAALSQFTSKSKTDKKADNKDITPDNV